MEHEHTTHSSEGGAIDIDTGTAPAKRPRTAGVTVQRRAGAETGAAAKGTRGTFDEDSMQQNFNTAMGFTGENATASQTSAENKAAIDAMKKAKAKLDRFIDHGLFDADKHWIGVEKRLGKLADLSYDIDFSGGVSKADGKRAQKYLVKGIQKVRMVLRRWASEKFVKEKYQSMITSARYAVVPLVKEVSRL